MMNQLNVQIDPIKDFILNIMKRPARNLAIVAIGLGASYCVHFTFKLYLERRRLRHIPGPPTKGIIGFYMGNLFEIKEEIDKGKVWSDVILKWHDIYGDVFKIQTFNQLMVFTSDPDTIKEALIVKNYPKPKAIVGVSYPLGERFLGDGLVTDLDQERWKHRRSIFNKGFHRNILLTFIGQFNQITNNLSEKLRSMADGKTVVNLFNEINRATLDAIALIAFGMNVDAVNQTDSILNLYLAKALQVTMESFMDPFMKLRPSKYSKVQEFRRVLHYIRKMGYEKILERISELNNNELIPNDILSSILDSLKSGSENLDMELMIDDFVTFFIAGQETTANALAFCFLEMGKNPEIVRKARDEIDRVLGERSDVTYQDVSDLKYCLAIFKETLRLYPPIQQTARRTPEKIFINGYQVPEDTDLFVRMISMYVNGRSEKFFKNPLEFRPERFLRTVGAESEVPNYVYLPFSLGPRNCIGQNFAQIEGVIVIAKLLQKFDFELDPTQSFEKELQITLRPKDGTRCFFKLRS